MVFSGGFDSFFFYNRKALVLEARSFQRGLFIFVCVGCGCVLQRLKEGIYNFCQFYFSLFFAILENTSLPILNKKLPLEDSKLHRNTFNPWTRGILTEVETKENTVISNKAVSPPLPLSSSPHET